MVSKDFMALIKKLLAYFLFAYLILLVLEQFRKGFVSNFFNLNYFLIFIVIAGIIVLWLGDYKEDSFMDVSSKNALFQRRMSIYISSVFAIISLVMMYIGIRFLGGIAVYIAFFSGLVVFIISMVVINGK